MWNLKNKKLYKWAYIQTEIVTDLENKFMVIKGERAGEGDKLGDGTDIYTWLYTK